MRRKLLSGVVAGGLLLASSTARADCADVFGCVCSTYDVVVVATVLEMRQDGYMSVELEQIHEIEPGAGDAFQVGEVVDALPDLQVQEGARAFLTAATTGSTDLVQFNQAESDGSIACSGVVFDEEDFIATATAADCLDLARAKGIEPGCVDEVHCAVRRPAPAREAGLSALAAVVAALGLSLRRTRRARGAAPRR
jgi:hypothetical protein